MPRIKSIKQKLTNRNLPARTSRHGRPLAEVYTIDIPEISRVVTKQDPKTGEFKTERKIVQHAIRRPMTPLEIEAARRNVLRAGASTQAYGKKNERKSVKKIKGVAK